MTISIFAGLSTSEILFRSVQCPSQQSMASICLGPRANGLLQGSLSGHSSSSRSRLVPRACSLSFDRVLSPERLHSDAFIWCSDLSAARCIELADQIVYDH